MNRSDRPADVACQRRTDRRTGMGRVNLFEASKRDCQGRGKRALGRMAQSASLVVLITAAMIWLPAAHAETWDESWSCHIAIRDKAGKFASIAAKASVMLQADRSEYSGTVTRVGLSEKKALFLSVDRNRSWSVTNDTSLDGKELPDGDWFTFDIFRESVRYLTTGTSAVAVYAQRARDGSPYEDSMEAYICYLE